MSSELEGFCRFLGCERLGKVGMRRNCEVVGYKFLNDRRTFHTVISAEMS